MCDLSISVAIATFNRSELLGRAIRSVLDQTVPAFEIIVVDDASTDGTAEHVRRCFPQVRYFAQERNQGCGGARNRALHVARAPYVLILDDDDTLLPTALEVIVSKMISLEHLEQYPVLNFAHGEGELAEPYILATLADYVRDKLRADFVPVIHRGVFLDNKLAYPLSKVGGEHMLWWKIAEKYGIPTWSDRVGTVKSDAPLRLTSVRSQVLHARDHARLQEQTLAEFGEMIRETSPNLYTKKLLGAAAYRLLAGDRSLSRSHLRASLRMQVSAKALALWLLTFIPAFLARRCFVSYRRWCGVGA